MKYLRKANQEFIDLHGKIKFIVLIWGAMLLAVAASFEPFFLEAVIDYLVSWIEGFNISLLHIVLLRWVYVLVLIWLRYTHSMFTRFSILKVYNTTLYSYMKRIHFLWYNDYLSQSKSELSKILVKWIESIWILIYQLILKYLYLVTFVATSVLVMIYTNWRMSIITLFLLPVLMYWTLSHFIKLWKKQDDLDEYWDETYKLTGDSMTNLWTIKTFGSESLRISWIADIIKKATPLQHSLMWSRAGIDMLGTVILMIVRIAVIVWWVYLYTLWLTTIGEIVLFLTFAELVYWPINELWGSLEDINKNQTAYKKLHEIFDIFDDGIEDLEKGGQLQPSWSIVFQNLSFDYSSNKPLFRGLSFSVPEWSSLALVWQTGTWKSTLAHLLLRFRKPAAGKITRWWEDVSTMSLQSLRSQIGVVQQDTTLFNASIYNNLLWIAWEEDSPELRERITDALESAQAWFVFTLPDGLDTVIGERWLKLSWWEKQRIALARVLLTRPKLLILDEATSALDTGTEQVVKQVIEKQFQNMTKIIIAHRLSTIQHVDQIIVLWKNSDGTTSIHEEWTYNELIEQQWVLWKLANPEEVEVRF